VVDGSAEPAERRGRPRRYDDGTERDLLLDTAIDLLKRNGSTEPSVVEILAETGLSTRSFYRHFESKEALLVALVRREAERVAVEMDRAIARAGGPRAAIETWMDRLLGTFFEPARARRSALLTTPSASTAYLMTDELAQIRWVLSRPLADVLRDGHAAGDLVSTNPAADAISLFAIAAAVARSPHAGLRDRGAVRAQVERLAWPALGLA
jgi:AcrR family transcriptional regulator